MKLNQRVRGLFSGTTQALFNSSVRVLSNPRARRLASRNRPMLLVLALCAVAIGLAVPLTGSPHKSYLNLRAQTPKTTAPGSSTTATIPQAPSSTSGGSSPSAAAIAGNAGPIAGSSTGASTSGSSATGAAISPSSTAAPSGGAATPSPSSSPASPAPATVNATNHSSARRPAHVTLTVGVSDNGEAMFEEGSFQRIHVKTARIMTPWNVATMRNKTQLNLVRKWLSSARSDHVAPMVSFAGNGNYIPSVPVYTAAIKAFLHDFPQVKIYTPWNEPDWIYRPALANNPSLAAGYFNTLIRWCHRCTIVAGDVYRPAYQGLASWVRAYARALHARPKAWAIHPYDDVRAHTSSQIRAFESVTSGAIWLTEISGVERRGHCGCPNLSPNRANVDERYLFGLPKRFPRIQRIYHYQWQAVAAAPWDSGLLGPQGKPRPAYYTFWNASKGKLP